MLIRPSLCLPRSWEPAGYLLVALDTDVLDHPGLNTCIFTISDIHTNNYNTCIFTIFDVFNIHTNNYNTCIFTIFDVYDMKCMYFIYLPYKGSPWDTEFCHPLIMTYLSQCLGSRVPPLDSAPPLSLALMYNRVVWDRLWMLPCTLIRVPFE